ncbi:MAG TPA: LamG domain-containing protein [Thermoanaerobaculia bacterium]|nr:LamG domain-containing protein [Thermoanaerobaculia bacterium]
MSLVSLFLVVASSAYAQPWGAWLNSPSTTHSSVQLPNSASLNFAGGSFTFEAWVNLVSPQSCASIAGNGWTQSQWIGICSSSLRSYIKGSASLFDAGTIPTNNWTHIAVTFDAATNVRSHYIDGELQGQRTETSGITPGPGPWRLLSDVEYEFTPMGAIEEVRFWNVARTRDQIRSTINRELRTAQPGLVSVYALEGSVGDAVSTNHATKSGPAGFVNVVPSVCTASTTQICIGAGNRFAVSATFRRDAGTGVTGDAGVVSFSTPESGIFWFFGANNWEMMTKVLNGCGINSRHWVFTSAVTDQHFELVVTDTSTGRVKRYFNYAGAPAPAITDIDAFATCP